MFSKRGFLLIPFVLAALLYCERPASACSCSGRPTVLEEYDRSTFIVIVRVVSVEKSDDEQRNVHGILSARLIVERVFKGNIRLDEEMNFAQGGGGDCIWTFANEDVGKRFLFYLSARRKGETIWREYICGRSKDLEQAGDDLLYLENLAKVRGKSRLSGTLMSYQTPSIEGEDFIYKGLDARKVRIIGEKTTYDLTTNNAGVYEIYDLPAGRYTVEPEVPDGLKIDDAYSGQPTDPASKKKPGLRVTLEERKHAFADFEYGVNNAVRGRVFDITGKAMKDVCLELFPAQGKKSTYLHKSDCTKQDGTFEITGIPPGTYVVGIRRRGEDYSKGLFQPFYYPNVFQREKAAIIGIAAGQLLEEINVTVPKMDESVTVEGVAYYVDGMPVVEGWIYFEAERIGDGFDTRVKAQTDSAGRFAIKVLKGLKGSLYGEMLARPEDFDGCASIEELIKKSGSGRGRALLRTNAIEIHTDENATNADLMYPFPDCRKTR